MQLIYFLSVFLFFLPSVFGEEAKREETLKPVVSTATRMETPEEEVTTSISSVSSDKIQQRQLETVLEALRSVPGIDVVQSGSRGNTASIFIRGSNANQVLVLIDGVEVNSPTTGQFDFAHLTTENIERVEILRGAGGTLFGSSAIGGVVNIITQRGRGKPEFTVSGEGGNKNTHRETLGLQGGTDAWGYSFSVARLATDGFLRKNDDYRNLTTAARLDYRVIPDGWLKGIFRFTKADLGLANSNNFVAGEIDPDAREALSRYVGQLEWAHKILPEWDYHVSGSVFKEHEKFTDEVDECLFFGFPCDTRSRSRFRPQIVTAEFQTNYRFGDWSTTTLGVEYKRRKVSTSSSSDGFDLGGIEKAIRNLGYYLQEQIKLFDDRLILVPGVRLDDHDTFGTEWSPAFSASYLFRQTGTRVRSGYTEGFRAPTLNELFFPPGFGCPAFGNPNLGPEKSWEVNAGIDQDWGKNVKLLATYFHREVKDLIEARPILGAPSFCSRAENVGQARFDGVETGITVEILTGLSFSGNYTYLNWHTEQKLVRRPRHRGNFGLNYAYDGFQINLNGNIVGRRDDRKAVNFSEFIKKPGYVKFDLAGSYKLPVEIPWTKSLSLFGKIENLFNQRYQETDGFPARPLNFLLGLRGVFGN